MHAAVSIIACASRNFHRLDDLPAPVDSRPVTLVDGLPFLSYIVAVTTNTVEYIADSDPSLRMMMLRYEHHYFRDFALRSALKSSPVIHGLIRQNEEDDPDSKGVTLNGWSIKTKGRLRKDGDLDGLCRMSSRAIILKKGLPKRRLRIVLLHEMVHAYEFQLSQARRELILVYLYGRLAKKLGESKLQTFIDIHSHGALYVPDHSLLFLLKSLDLDVRLKKAFGTVAAYGRMESFKKT